ncbi:MAG: HpcH/HpaI aldolase/citrate lyase family protein [Devosia sp.]
MRFRSLLYVPANSEPLASKAHERGADAIILDLEDAVPPAEKERARAGLGEAAAAAGRNGAKVFVQISAEPELQKLDAEAACLAGAFGLFLPKARDHKAIADLSAYLTPIERQMRRDEMPFVALIEDPGAVLDARAIARVPRVMALSTGSEDLALAMGAEPTPEVLRYPKLLVHYAAKAEGLLSFGLLRSIADYGDPEAIRIAAEEAKTYGFDGASCVHPAAVPILNAALAASPDEIEWARRAIQAADDARALGVGATTLNGKMIDAPVVTRARKILAAGAPAAVTVPPRGK